MVAVELFLRYEVHGRVVIGEVVRHRHDLALDFGCVSAFLEYDEAFAQVLFARGQLRVLACSHRLERAFDGDGVLLGIGNAFDAAHGVGMALADTASPERVIGALRQDAVAHQAVQREQARVPTARNERACAACFGGFIDGVEMSGDVGMGVEAVDHVVQVCVVRRLLGQVGGASAAQDEDVDGLLTAFERCGGLDLEAFCCYLYASRVAARIHRHQVDVVVLAHGQFDAFAKIAVTQDAQAHVSHIDPFDCVCCLVQL